MPLMPQAGEAGQPPPPSEGAPPGAPPGGAPPEVQSGPPPPASRPARSEGDVDPQQVEMFVEKSFELIYGGKTEDGELNAPIAAMLRRDANDPTTALAKTAANIASSVFASAADGNFSIDPAAAFAGMMEVVGELATVAGMEGIYDFGQDEVDAAAVRASEALYAMTAEQGGGLVSQEEAMMDAGDIAQSSQSGELDEAIRQIQQADSVAAGASPAGAGFMGEQ